MLFNLFTENSQNQRSVFVIICPTSEMPVDMDALGSNNGDVANDAKNGTSKNKEEANVEQLLWDSYNHLMLSPDVERLRKTLAREELFRRTIDIPGDIVECGVFKVAVVGIVAVIVNCRMRRLNGDCCCSR